MIPSLTEDQVLTALRGFLLTVLPSGVEVVLGQDNSVPMPSVSDFVVMTPARREQLSATTHDYAAQAGTEDIARATAFHFQLDTYGPSSSDNVQVISTLLRDAYGCSYFKPHGIAPLYCDDGQQMPLVTGEQQYLGRWMMRCVLEANVAVTVPMQFADNLVTTLLEVD
jgi:hypothetical protein